MEAARPATTDDLGRLVELLAQSHEVQSPARGGRLWSAREARAVDDRSSLAAAIDDPERCVVVGTIDDTVVGYGVVVLEHLRTGERLAVTEDLWVEPEARGVGVGEAVMARLIEFAEAHGCAGIDALALPGDRATKNFFESFGLVARALVVHRPLGEGHR